MLANAEFKLEMIYGNYTEQNTVFHPMATQLKINKNIQMKIELPFYLMKPNQENYSLSIMILMFLMKLKWGPRRNYIIKTNLFLVKVMGQMFSLRLATELDQN
jgi:hypothetical protein